MWTCPCGLSRPQYTLSERSLYTYTGMMRITVSRKCVSIRQIVTVETLPVPYSFVVLFNSSLILTVATKYISFAEQAIATFDVFQIFVYEMFTLFDIPYMA